MDILQAFATHNVAKLPIRTTPIYLPTRYSKSQSIMKINQLKNIFSFQASYTEK